MGAKSSTPSVKNVTDKITKFQLELSLLENSMRIYPLPNSKQDLSDMFTKIRSDVNDFGNTCISSMWTGNWNQDHINTHIQILTKHLTTLEGLDAELDERLAKSRQRCVVLLSDILLPLGPR